MHRDSIAAESSAVNHFDYCADHNTVCATGIRTSQREPQLVLLGVCKQTSIIQQTSNNKQYNGTMLTIGCAPVLLRPLNVGRNAPSSLEPIARSKALSIAFSRLENIGSLVQVIKAMLLLVTGYLAANDCGRREYWSLISTTCWQLCVLLTTVSGSLAVWGPIYRGLLQYRNFLGTSSASGSVHMLLT